MNKTIILALAASGALLCSANAEARGHVSWSIGINAPVVGAVVSNGPVYGYPVYESYPVYAPAPYYVQPAPVYYGPAPVVYGPPAYYYGSHYGYRGYRGYRGGYGPGPYPRHWR